MTEACVIAAPWALSTGEDVQALPRLDRIEQAPCDIPREADRVFLQAGLDIAPRSSIDDASLARAGALIARLPDLWDIVAARVDRVAILRSADDCFDISHSDPAWPGLILVSIPPATPVGDLRLAEGIIHEAMHHHLSALENSTGLVACEARYYSPWKESERPASGVLHGLFVFACIAYALRQIVDTRGLDERQTAHARCRISDINEEFSLVDHGALLKTLTSSGRRVHAQTVNALQLARQIVSSVS